MFPRMMRWLEEEDTRRVWILSGLCLLLLCARFYKGLLHAELWGDDGWTFYPDAYNSGIRCLAWPVSGYLNTVQRLGALTAVWGHVPLLWVPTLFAVMALSVQIAVALFLLSSRLAPLWQSWRSRAAFALLYILLPNSFETFGNLTNSQWHMGLLAFLIVVSPPGARPGWRIFDAVVLVLSSLSGPFCVLLVPFCAANYWRYRRQESSTGKLGTGKRGPGELGTGKRGTGERGTGELWTGELWTRNILLGAGALVQAMFVFHGHAARQLSLGATPLLLARIIAYRLVLGLLLGMRGIARIGMMRWWQAAWAPIAISIGAIAVSVIGFVRGNYLFRSFSLFSLLLFTVEMMSPRITGNADQWPAMLGAFPAQRYFLAPMLALLGALFVLAAQRARAERLTGMLGIALVACCAVPLDFVYMHMSITDYDAKAREFDAAPAGTRVVLPEHPDGGNVMVLVKK